MANENVKDWYFNLKPFTGSRQAEGFFIDEQKYKSDPAWFFNRMINDLDEKDAIAAEQFDTCVIDVSPTDSSGFVIDSKSSLFVRCVEFKMDNSPINLADYMYNTSFATAPVPATGTGTQTLDEFNHMPWTVRTIPTGFYPDQTAIVEAMNRLDPTVLFEFTARQTVRYTGSTVLLIPVKGTIPYLIDHDQLGCTSQFQLVPPNVSGLTQTRSTNVNATFPLDVNGEQLSVKYSKMWDYQDSLAAKLGFTSGDKQQLVRFYFDYPQIAGLPNNTSASTVDAMQSEEGAIFVAVYPGAEAPTCGNVYGAMSNVTIVCQEVYAPIEFENILQKINVQGQPAYSTFEIADTTSWLPIKQQGVLKHLTFNLLDDLRRPYKTTTGPPYIRIELKAE
ncbi:MAG: hypothetical protein ACRC0J_11350 [Shewanella oncorhynchi]